MSKQLYEDALADIKKLKEVAEDNAKRDLLEAVTPRIRDLIEKQLLGQFGEFADDDSFLTDDECYSDNNIDGEMQADIEEMPMSAVSYMDASTDAESSDEDGKTVLDLASLKVDGSDEYELSMESAKKLGMLMGKHKRSAVVFEEKLNIIARQIKLVKTASKLIKESKGYGSTISSLILEVENMYSYLQKEMQKNSKKDSYESILENYYSTLKQLAERNTMKKTNRSRRLSEGDVTLKLTGMPDELDLDSIGVDLITGEGDDEGGDDEGGDDEGGDDEGGDDLDLGGDDEGGDDEGGDDLDLGGDDEGTEDKMESRRLSNNTIVEIDERMLRREISRMRTLREEATPSTDGHGPGDVSDDFEDDSYGDPFTDIKLTTETQDDDEDDLEEAQDQDEDDLEETQDQDEDDLEEMQVDQGYGMDQGHDDDKDTQSDVVESLKRKFRHEIRIQTEAKKKATQAKKMQKEAQKQDKAAKTQSKKKQAKTQAKKMQEAYNFFASKFNASVKRTRAIKGMLQEAVRKGRTLNGSSARFTAATKNLRNKLAETNLFNTKLLFTNKLLQNESLTKRQKAEVIERLDEARNEREVKLVYESLVKTLQGSAPKNLSESATRGVIGSGSRPSRSASSTATLNEGFEADRWARLAGIVK
jgi:hypothetical protein